MRGKMKDQEQQQKQPGSQFQRDFRLKGLPCGSAGKDICLQCWRPGFDPWVGKIPWRRVRLPTPVFWPGEFHGLCSPWGRKESDTTGRLSLSLSAVKVLVVVVSVTFASLYIKYPLALILVDSLSKISIKGS